MKPDILALFVTYDRCGVLRPSLESMFADPGMDFRLWVLDNGSAFSELYGAGSGMEQVTLLFDYYLDGKIQELIFLNANYGIHHPLNMLMAHAKLNSNNPHVRPPEFVFRTNDDMLYEPGWLKVCYDTLLACENYPGGKVTVVSPFHCYHPDGRLAQGMWTTDHWQADDGATYEIKENVSGNTWFMRGETWLTLFDWLPVNDPTEGGDWQDLAKNNAHGFKCVVTPQEMAHHHPDAAGGGKWDRLRHW